MLWRTLPILFVLLFIASCPGVVFAQEEKSPEVSELGVDDEVMRIATTVYQPIRRLRKQDFDRTDAPRDEYLDAVKTLRGITIMGRGPLLVEPEVMRALTYESDKPSKRKSENTESAHSKSVEEMKANREAEEDVQKKPTLP